MYRSHAHEILNDIFGYNEFRGQQEEIRQVLKGQKMRMKHRYVFTLLFLGLFANAAIAGTQPPETLTCTNEDSKNIVVFFLSNVEKIPFQYSSRSYLGLVKLVEDKGEMKKEDTFLETLEYTIVSR
jgi:hypothetical protein